jgi:ABC-type microcin C transport system duplicated ATPase subunit YejF
VGESGSGKSMTAYSMLKLLPSQTGRIEGGQIKWRDEQGGEVDLTQLPESELRKIRGGDIAMIFQEPMTSLNPVMSIGAQLIEAIKTHQEIGEGGARARTSASLILVWMRSGSMI